MPGQARAFLDNLAAAAVGCVLVSAIGTDDAEPGGCAGFLRQLLHQRLAADGRVCGPFAAEHPLDQLVEDWHEGRRLGEIRSNQVGIYHGQHAGIGGGEHDAGGAVVVAGQHVVGQPVGERPRVQSAGESQRPGDGREAVAEDGKGRLVAAQRSKKQIAADLPGGRRGKLHRHLQAAAGRVAQPLQVGGVDQLAGDVEDRLARGAAARPAA